MSRCQHCGCIPGGINHDPTDCALAQVSSLELSLASERERVKELQENLRMRMDRINDLENKLASLTPAKVTETDEVAPLREMIMVLLYELDMNHRHCVTCGTISEARALLSRGKE